MSRSKILLGCVCSAALVLACRLEGAEPTIGKPSGDSADEKLDYIAQAREINSKQYAPPPTEFREGHVTPRDLSADLVRQTERGYRIQLPSNSPVPTPTVFGGKLYVSGGFHSKEFYCFDAATGKPVWACNLDDDGPTSAACESGVTVFNTESCTLFALDAETGKMLWSRWLGDPLTATPTIAGDKVFTSYPAGGRGAAANQAAPKAALEAAGEDPFAEVEELFKEPDDDAKAADAPPQPAPGKANASKATPKKMASPKPGAEKQRTASHVLACFELRTGKILWQRWLDSDVMSAPVAVDEELYVATFSGVVYKFKQADGTILSAQRSRATSAPTVVGKNVYLTQRADKGRGETASERVAAVDRDSARQKFAAPAKEAKYLDARVQAKSELKVGGMGGMALDAGNGFAGGAPVAANAKAALANIGQDNVSTLQAFQGSRLLHLGGSNFGCMGNELVCSSADTGQTQWSVKLKGELEKAGGFLGSPPAAAGGELFLATFTGDVLRVDPRQGKVLETYHVGSPLRFQVAVDGGRIYASTQDGQVVCFDTKNPALTGWSTWGGNSAHTGVADK